MAHPTRPATRFDRPVILALETSCDETAVAVVRGADVSAHVLASQHDIHGKFGGVVPELAARRHIETIETLVLEAMERAGLRWADLDAVAVTRGPGLAGALLVGVNVGKGIAYTLGLPVVAVNHLEGHIASAWLEQPEFPRPCVVLVASGGHTHLYLIDSEEGVELLGATLDDAAGEAFDKGAKMLGLDYPGGPAIDRLAASGNPHAIRFPRAYLKRGSLDFSFSGLKTALLYHLRDLQAQGRPCPLEDLAASYQEAIVEVLARKALDAVERTRVRALAVVGGVSANSRLRAILSDMTDAAGLSLAIPSPKFCTDNAVMIAAGAVRRYQRGLVESWDLEAQADLSVVGSGAGSSTGAAPGAGRRAPRITSGTRSGRTRSSKV